ncbi:hypothetical protein F3Y22_tig00111708pilonHSYRG00191 [Hibiscus syriacus]|uniref:Uncharacterized protein n=1 Tax=Hibiscus syriacus TaxID=106335 RepID=A0A6A2YGZ0_HIBSY|nr:hypothetical protein F3Y22_tig00111708pilonHSYRG00191 [Hibiscus syriacus]
MVASLIINQLPLTVVTTMLVVVVDHRLVRKIHQQNHLVLLVMNPTFDYLNTSPIIIVFKLPAGADAVGVTGGDGAAAFGGEIQQQHQCSPDEDDGFIHWLCGEFAAVNAMTDLLCHHLLEIGEVGGTAGVHVNND